MTIEDLAIDLWEGREQSQEESYKVFVLFVEGVCHRWIPVTKTGLLANMHLNQQANLTSGITNTFVLCVTNSYVKEWMNELQPGKPTRTDEDWAWGGGTCL